MWGIDLLRHSPPEVSALLGVVVLAITGAEALYADMGHFGRKFITLAWYGAAFPGLVLNYFGQGAYILAHPGITGKPLLRAGARRPAARAAHGSVRRLPAIIASQALNLRRLLAHTAGHPSSATFPA